MDDTSPTGMPEGIPGKIPVESEKPTGLGNQPSSFESYMQGTAGQPKGVPAGPTAAQGPSPMDLAKPTAQTAGPTFDSLITQAKTAQDGLGNIGQQMKDPQLKLKRSQSQLLKHKLQDANDHIRAAGDRVGVAAPTPRKTTETGPLAHFLGMIGQGQDDLLSVQNEIKKLSADPEHLRPGDMMYMQIKMGQAQQEIEYSSTLLGKAVDALKQVLNTQL